MYSRRVGPGGAAAFTLDSMTTTEAGRRLRPYGLDDRYQLVEGDVLLTGVQALVRLPFDQVRADRHVNRRVGVFISGYEGSPLGGYDQALMREPALCAEHDVCLRPAVNEELAATAVWGSQQDRLGPLDGRDGVVGIWYGKAPGVDRTGDVFKHANLMGVAPNGGVVVLAGDDPSSKSSTVPSHSEVALSDAQMPVLAPGSPQEVLDIGLHAFALSRFSGLWTAMKIVTDVADGFATVTVGPARILPVLPELSFEGVPWHHRQGGLAIPPGNLRDEHELIYRRLEAARAYGRENRLDEVVSPAPDARLGIIASGKAYRDVLSALASLRVPYEAVRLLRVGMIWPLDRVGVQRFSAGLDEIVVVEEKRSFLELQVRDALYDLARRPRVVGKRSPDGRVLIPADSELTPDRIRPALQQRLREFAIATGGGEDSPAPRQTIPLASVRTPFFCSGCPHNRSTQLPEGSIAGGGIGCHTLAVYLEDRNTASVTQMGGEGAQWIGRSPFTTTPHIFQNIGDGTLFHSGSLAIRACVAAGVNITYKILYNGTVAMTGGQDAVGAIPVPDLTRLLEAEGVTRTIVCAEDPGSYGRAAAWAGTAEVWPRTRLDEAQRVLREVPGVTVLIYDQACAAERRRKRSRGLLPKPATRVLINERVCEGCGDCVAKSNCLSVEPVATEFGTKRRIHQSSCNQDYTCLEGDCPSFVTFEPATTTSAVRHHAAAPIDDGELPEPVRLVPDHGPFSLCLFGIGGTGVVTMSQVLGTAALLEGRHVAGLDQTGLSQKAGAVLSHLHFGDEPWMAAAAAPNGQADLLMAFDLDVALDEKNLRRARRGAHVTASVDLTPTGSMVRTSQPATGGAERAAALADAVEPSSMQLISGSGAAQRLFGNHLLANVIVLGAAYQAGQVPLGAAAIEQALTLNGRNVEQSIQAFRWGRRLSLDPDAAGGEPGPAVAGAGAAVAVPPRLASRIEGLRLGTDVTRILERRAGELVDYQSAGWAERYIAFVAGVAAAEQRAVPGSERLTAAVGRHLFDLMAYKDEYEVARLYLDSTFQAQLAGAGKVRIHLHPPALRALGLQRKLALGPWVMPILRALRGMRRLRGTPLDPFGRTHVRREERAVIREYEEAMARLLPGLSAATIDHAVAVAELPDEVRGYEEIKLRAIARFRSDLAALMTTGS